MDCWLIQLIQIYKCLYIVYMYIYVRHLYTVVYKDMGKVKNVSETTKRNRAFFELGEEFFHVLRLHCTGRDRNRSSENAQLDHRVCEIKTKPQGKYIKKPFKWTSACGL